jgi:hypothetical protein
VIGAIISEKSELVLSFYLPKDIALLITIKLEFTHPGSDPDNLRSSQAS